MTLSAPVLVSARFVLGGVFIYLGVTKAVDPVGFLKLVREFHVLETAPALNLVAALLPWFEVFCGALLLLGAKARAAALLQGLLLLGFTALIVTRALALHASGNVPFCALRFDCGCGTGEVLVCLKLVENTALMLLAGVVATSRIGKQPR